jgi:hypothetical protein
MTYARAMRAALLLIIAACGGCGSGGADLKLATPDAAKAVATKLASALTACDKSQVHSLIDRAFLAGRATSDKAFIDLVMKEPITCDATYAEVVERAPPRNAKPLLRWRQGRTTACEMRSFGYIEVTVDKQGRIADLEMPLNPQTVVKSLHNIHGNLPSFDWPGMISDILYIIGSPLTSLDTGATFASRLNDPARTYGAEPPPEDLGRLIEYAFRAHDYVAVQVAVNKVAAIVGEDPLLASLRIAAAIGANDGAYALKLATDATTKWPVDLDAWCMRVPAEVAGGTKASIEAAKAELKTRFGIEMN